MKSKQIFLLVLIINSFILINCTFVKCEKSIKIKKLYLKENPLSLKKNICYTVNIFSSGKLFIRYKGQSDVKIIIFDYQDNKGYTNVVYYGDDKTFTEEISATRVGFIFSLFINPEEDLYYNKKKPYHYIAIEQVKNNQKYKIKIVDLR